MPSHSKPKLFLLIPLYNEGENIGTLYGSLKALRKRVSEEFAVQVFFIDDGSTDGTADRLMQLAEDTWVNVVSLPENQGPGAAFAQGFRTIGARLSPYDWVVTMEGDATSDTATLEHMLQRRHEGYHLVLASPYLYGGGFSRVTPDRLLLSHFANAMVKVLLGIRGIATFSSFFRLYSSESIQRLQIAFGKGIIETNGFECMVELLAKAAHLKLRISEVETYVDWSKRRGKSKMRRLRTSLAYLRLFRLWPGMVQRAKVQL